MSALEVTKLERSHERSWEVDHKGGEKWKVVEYVLKECTRKANWEKKGNQTGKEECLRTKYNHT